MKRSLLIALLIFTLIQSGCQPVAEYTIVADYPHDPAAFTQGLLFHEGYLYESTGLKGRSSLRKVELTSGKVIRKRKLPPHLFGEGLALCGDSLIQLTWHAGKAIVYDLPTFTIKNQFKYQGEGWGLTYDGQHLIMSDGTSYLRYFDPATFTESKRIRVMNENAAVTNLNELEYINGQILANVWQTDKLVRIDPKTGKVIGWINLSDLCRKMSTVGVLNGIAYDEQNDRLFVTGKNWPKIYEIKLP